MIFVLTLVFMCKMITLVKMSIFEQCIAYHIDQMYHPSDVMWADIVYMNQ